MRASKIFRIEVDRDLCIGAGNCAAAAAGAFALDSESKSYVRQTAPDWGDSDENILKAAKNCPTKAIFVYDRDGREISPE